MDKAAISTLTLLVDLFYRTEKVRRTLRGLEKRRTELVTELRMFSPGVNDLLVKEFHRDRFVLISAAFNQISEVSGDDALDYQKRGVTCISF